VARKGVTIQEELPSGSRSLDELGPKAYEALNEFEEKITAVNRQKELMKEAHARGYGEVIWGEIFTGIPKRAGFFSIGKGAQTEKT
jgi:hypothetical protein